EFLALLAGGLRLVGAPEDPAHRFLAALFERPEPSDRSMLPADDAGRYLIQAMLAVVEHLPNGNLQLRRTILRYLEHAGAHEAWRAEAIAVLGRLSGDLKPDADRVLRQIRPPEPDPDLDDAPPE